MLKMFKDIKDKLDNIFRQQETISNDLEDLRNRRVLLEIKQQQQTNRIKNSVGGLNGNLDKKKENS